MAEENPLSSALRASSELNSMAHNPVLPPQSTEPGSGIEGEDQEFGSFVEAAPIAALDAFDPLSTDNATPAAGNSADGLLDPLSTLQPVSGASDVSENLKPSHNLIDEIMDYERNPTLLFNDDKLKAENLTTDTSSAMDNPTKMSFHDRLPHQPLTPTGGEATVSLSGATTETRLPSPLPPPAFDPALDPLIAAQAIQTPAPGSGLTPAPLKQPPALSGRTPVEPIAKGGGVAIEKNLGLIDQDYFTSREPAETVPIVSTPLASAGPSTPRPHSLPPRSPGWSLKGMIPSQRPSPSHSREHTGEAAQEEPHQHHQHHHRPHHQRQPSSPSLPHVRPAPPVVTPGLNRDLLDLDLSGDTSQDLPTPHPLDLPTPVPVPPRADDGQLFDVPESFEGSHTMSSPSEQNYGTLSKIPSWIGSFLGASSGDSDALQARSSTRGRPSSGSSSTSSLQSDKKSSSTNYYPHDSPSSDTHRPDSGHSQSPNSFSKHASAVTPPSGGYEPVHGQRGRPLPRARPSLEGIQQLYGPPSKSRSRSRPSHSPVARQREPTPVNITHSTPFAPPQLHGGSQFSASYSASINAGFSPMTKANTLPATAGLSSAANPFSTPTFTPIPGAPGFKPNDYDWDKGFSDELNEELKEDDFPTTSRQADEEEEDAMPSGLGSIFGFGTFGRKSSSDRIHTTSPPQMSMGPSRPYAYGHSRTVTEPTQSTTGQGTSSKDTIMYATSRPIQKTNSRGSTVPPATVSQLIEKKVGSVMLKERKLSTEAVLNQELADLIRPHLPPLSRLPKTWTLLYSLDQHGISLNTLYNNCETPLRTRKSGQNYIGMGGVVLIVRDSETSEQSVDGTFGAFIAEGLGRKSKGFFGGGDSFLWKYSDGELQVFKASGRNTYFAICESDYMAFGGGSTSYGLYIDSGLLEGYSAPSLTFGNETLSNSASGTTSSASRPAQAEFECVGLEVWGVGPN